MRILVVGKYPPIEGGTSNQTFATIRSLVKRGHHIDVLTNSDEVELSCRQMFLPDDSRILDSLTTSSTGGTVTVHQTTYLRNNYIPWAQPYLSKLFGIGMDLVRSGQFDLIVGWYMEPYGLVAAQIAQVAGLPLLLTHAGSDIRRLARHPDLRLAYRWAFQRADHVLTGDRHREALVDLGANPERLLMGFSGGMPDYFSAPYSPLDLEEFAPAAIERFKDMDPPGPIMELLRRNLERRPILPDVPVIGIYGKVGESKGSHDLISALEILASRGVPFTLLGAIGGQPHAFYPFVDELESTEHLRERTVLLPFLAPWRVPHFLDACDLVCFLERKFSISVHFTRVPQEVLKRGRALVLSAEISQKTWFRDRLDDGGNYILVPDPSHVQSLAERLEHYASDLPAIRRIGESGGSLASELYGSEHPDGAAMAIESTLSEAPG
jgi:glycosyltransferase involved in cell wall biosynthesis